MRKANLPYVLIGGTSFYDRKEVRDVLAYLRVVDSHEDEVSLLRIINTPARGIGKKAIEELLSNAVSQGTPMWNVLKDELTLKKIGPTARRGIEKLVGMFEQFNAKLKSASLVDIANALITDVGYEQELSRLYPDVDERTARWSAVEQVVNSLGEYERAKKKPSLTGFLDEIALGDRQFDNEKDKQLSQNAIALMTLHSAKGLEFPEVYLVGLEEGILPHHRSVEAEGEAIDEERRLCYVGVTRAQERLTLSLPLTRMKWGKPRDTLPSRFLYEMTGQADNPYDSARMAQGARKRAKRKATEANRAAPPKRKTVTRKSPKK